VIYGRSDSTINRGGVRMGTSEIYSAVEGVPEVLDSLVVDVEDEMILFVVVRESLTDEVVAEIRRRVREDCSPRHLPDQIVQIPEVPRTLSNKKLEVPVKKILLGAAPESAASRDSLANPDALDWIADFRVRAS
jgi:acetoacetyl-CoA synthetase